ncbi:hypothetical protein EYR38_007356 [Pleurotus pulmonarius]|nr:hypothetical protein EYR38_007356 [Pleurotus pulmonarius]
MQTSNVLIPANKPKRVEATSDEPAYEVWFKTAPLSEEIIRSLTCVRLTTTAREQGQAQEDVLFSGSDGNSWFELVIFESSESTTPLVSKEGMECVWHSHYNKITDEDDTTVDGLPFYKEDDLLQFLEPDYVLAVRICVCYPAWVNCAASGHIQLWFQIDMIGDLATKSDTHDAYSHRSGPPAYDAQIPEVPLNTELDNFETKLKGFIAIASKHRQKNDAVLEKTEKLNPEGPANQFSKPPSLTQHQMGALRLLSIDGGGVRGISSLVILQNIMRKLTDDPNVKPCDYFDMICGTSTGGLIALMLGRLRMSIPQCICAYKKFACKIFKHNSTTSTILNIGLTGFAYSPGAFESAVKAIVKDYSKGTGDTMIPKSSDHTCKVFVVATEVNNVRMPHRIRTYKSATSDMFSDIPIWQAARATSAAPTYFPSIKIGCTELADGGLTYNNPVALLLEEAYNEFGLVRLHNTRCLLTLGTGRPPPLRLPPNSTSSRGICRRIKVAYLIKLIKLMANLATDCEDTHKRAKHIFRADSIYWRFNYKIHKGGEILQLDRWQEMGTLIEQTNKFLEGEEQATRVKNCALRLKE